MTSTPEERKAAAEKVMGEVMPSLRAHDAKLADRVLAYISAPDTKETFYAHVAIDLQIQLTRLENEKAALIHTVADLSGKLAKAYYDLNPPAEENSPR